MSALDTWLEEKYQLKRSDLPLRAERIIDNASRYSKEVTPPRVSGDIEEVVEGFLDEVDRSKGEDDRGEYRPGENVQISSEIAAVRLRLSQIGKEVLLSAFPFKEVPASITFYVRQALQKEMSIVIEKIKTLSFIDGVKLYVEPALTDALNEEFAISK